MRPEPTWLLPPNTMTGIYHKTLHICSPLIPYVTKTTFLTSLTFQTSQKRQLSIEFGFLVAKNHEPTSYERLRRRITEDCKIEETKICRFQRNSSASQKFNTEKCLRRQALQGENQHSKRSTVSCYHKNNPTDIFRKKFATENKQDFPLCLSRASSWKIH